MELTDIAFIGAGKMATAIAAGLVNKKVLAGEKISAFDVAEEARSAFVKNVPGANCEKDLVSLLSKSSFIVLAVKPQYVKEALKGAEDLLKGKLLLSICAGVSIATLQELSSCEKVIRVMPNTPALAGEGMSAFACSKAVIAEEKAMAEKVLGSIGEVRELGESLLDAVTGLSGSGPAYVMEFIMALTDGGGLYGTSQRCRLPDGAPDSLGDSRPPQRLCRTPCGFAGCGHLSRRDDCQRGKRIG